jgi:hypothetical protein
MDTDGDVKFRGNFLASAWSRDDNDVLLARGTAPTMIRSRAEPRANHDLLARGTRASTTRSEL